MSNEIVKSDSDAVLAVIERVAINPEADPEKLERMLDMQERILGRNAEMAFNSAMNRAQSMMGRISADAQNNQTRSKYATYAALDRVLRPIYTECGFSLSFDTEPGEPGIVTVLCHVSHAQGHSRKYRVTMPADGKGAKGGDVMTKTHAAGAAMSYGMRYLLKLIFNIAVGEDDDDGNLGDISALAEATTQIRGAENLEDLRRIFERAWNDHPGSVERKCLSAAKDRKKRELTNGAR